MNKAKLKSCAPQARQDLIAAATARANLLGSSQMRALGAFGARLRYEVILGGMLYWRTSKQ